MADLTSFLMTTGRTLSQMALYSPDHPAVKGAIEESHRLLSAMLEKDQEMVLSLHENSLLVNGEVPKGVSPLSVRPFVVLLNHFSLHSLTFTQSISQAELIPFFQLAARQGNKSEKIDVAEFLGSNRVVHIKVNQARYAKIGEDETVGGGGGAGAGGDGPGGGTQGTFVEKVEQLPLDQFMTQVIKKAVTNPEDQRRLFERVSELVKKEIQKAVEKETRELRHEKEVVTLERERTEEVVGTMADGVVVVDESGNVLMMNSAAEEIYGVQLGSCVGKPLWSGVKKEQMIALAKDLSAPTQKPSVKEVQLKADQETQKTLRASSATIQDPNGRIVGMVSVLSDVTKQKELNRQQNEFLANVTHDLRSPIHTIKLAVSSILETAAGPVTPEQKRMLTLASRNVDRLSRLINDLLDLSQLESGQFRVRPQMVDLSVPLRDAVASMEGWAKARHIQLEFEMKEPAPPVYADLDRILQVVNNLVSNAIKFTPNMGRVVVRLKNVTEGGKARLRIDVEDSGKGISKPDQDRIFKRFVQLENKEKLDIRGTGLGLSICQGLVGQHKGELRMESPVSGKKDGSLFWFTLPAGAPASESRAPAAAKPASQPRSTSEKKGFWEKLLERFKLSALLVVLIPALVAARPYSGKVRRVLEGDLIQLENGTVVRYLGIDAPNKGNRYFPEAYAANKSWVHRKEVQFRYGLQERDSKGVWLAYVFVDGTFVNLELVRSGNALVTRLSNDEKYLPELLRAEKEARQKKRGFWSDSVLGIEPYNVRVRQKDALPWISDDEMKKGIKK